MKSFIVVASLLLHLAFSNGLRQDPPTEAAPIVSDPEQPVISTTTEMIQENTTTKMVQENDTSAEVVRKSRESIGVISDGENSRNVSELAELSIESKIVSRLLNALFPTLFNNSLTSDASFEGADSFKADTQDDRDTGENLEVSTISPSLKISTERIIDSYGADVSVPNCVLDSQLLKNHLAHLTTVEDADLLIGAIKQAMILRETMDNNSEENTLYRYKRSGNSDLPDVPTLVPNTEITDRCRPALIGTSITLVVIGVLSLGGLICLCKK